MTSNRCANYILCSNNAVGIVCKYCEASHVKINTSVSRQECPVCFEHGDCIEFPSGCRHVFCVECIKKIVLPNEHYFFISPVPFGCEPCPNGCINPLSGVQCDCDEHADLLDSWRIRDKQAYMEWVHAESLSIENGLSGDTCIGNGKCPMCRSSFHNYIYHSDSDSDFIDDEDCHSDSGFSDDTYECYSDIGSDDTDS